MKRSFPPRAATRRGFTLIEIIVTISIIALLSTLALIAMNYANRTSKMRKAQAQLRTIESFLERYYADYGTYPRPITEDGGTSVNIGGVTYPAGGAIALYQALSGDGDTGLEGGSVAPQGELGSAPGSTVYWADLDPRSNPQQLVFEQNGQYMLVDPWGIPWQYQLPPRLDSTGPDDPERFKQKYHNTTKYDLWSFGGTKPEEFGQEGNWIKNW